MSTEQDPDDPVCLLLSLTDNILREVLLYLDPEDLCAAGTVCSRLRELVAEDSLWQALAQRLWPAATLIVTNPSPYPERHRHPYTSFKELVLDDNRRWALPTAQLRTSCVWKANSEERYYECRLLALQWDRLQDTLRLLFDARGEADLRPASGSSLAVVATQEPEQLDSSTSPAAGRLLVSAKPIDAELCVDGHGHKKGALHWSGPAVAAFRRHLASEPDASLVFCYASDLTHKWRSPALLDYSLAPLLQLQRGRRWPWKEKQAEAAAAGAQAHAVTWAGSSATQQEDDEEEEEQQQQEEQAAAAYRHRQPSGQPADPLAALFTHVMLPGAAEAQLKAEGSKRQAQRWAHLPQEVRGRPSAVPAFAGHLWQDVEGGGEDMLDALWEVLAGGGQLQQVPWGL